MMGALVRDYGKPGMAVSGTRGCRMRRMCICVPTAFVSRSGVYAMVGSASMLAGFKQMAVAVVVFITGCHR